MSFKVEMIATSGLQLHPDNGKYFKDIDGELWRAFLADVAEHGIREPLTVDRSTGFVVKGNQRLRAALELGIDEVPVMYQDYASPDEAIDDLIRDNVMRRDMSFFAKYRLVSVLKERIESRQGNGGGNFSESSKQRTSVQNAQKFESPRDQIAKLLGLHQKDVAAASVLSTLPDDVQKQFFLWAEDANPSKKEAQEKVRELAKVKKELRELKDLRKMAKRKDELERGMEILMQEGAPRLADAEASTRITQTIAEGWNWLSSQAAAIEVMQVSPGSLSACAPIVNEFVKNLDAYRDAIVAKFTGSPRT
jgi:ParB family chromosome partitioning protein